MTRSGAEEMCKEQMNVAITRTGRGGGTLMEWR